MLILETRLVFLEHLLSLLRLLENGMAFHPHAFSNKPREKIGVIIFPTRTTRYKKGSPLKFICMCIVWSPSNFVISWPLHTPTYPNHLLWGFTGVLSLSSHKLRWQNDSICRYDSYISLCSYFLTACNVSVPHHHRWAAKIRLAVQVGKAWAR